MPLIKGKSVSLFPWGYGGGGIMKKVTNGDIRVIGV